MNVGYCAYIPMIWKASKWPYFSAQYHAHVASWEKDANLCIAKGSLNVDNNNGSSQDDLQQGSRAGPWASQAETDLHPTPAHTVGVLHLCVRVLRLHACA